MNKLESLVYEFYRVNYKNVALEIDGIAKEVLDLEKEGERFKLLADKVQFPNKIKVLEVGCGFGGFSKYLAINGHDVCGIEPDINCLEICRLRSDKLENLQFIQGKGEHIPFHANEFDLVVSFQALEHVQNPEMVLSEMIRVAKPKGVIHIVAPNYNSFWEPHYAVIFPMFFGKKIFKKLLVFKKRNIEFLDTLKFITHSNIVKYLGNKVTIIDDGKDLFKSRMITQMNIGRGQSKKLMIPVMVLNYFRLVRFFSYLMCKTSTHYPIHIVAIKN